jgi:hypothetical protein
MNTTPMVSMVLSALALLIYVVCCGVNWSWQLWFLSSIFYLHPYQVIGFVSLMLVLVYDDLVLMKWLWKNVGHKFALYRGGHKAD